MVAFERVQAEPYRMECRLVDVNEVCNQEKKVPLEWITGNGSDVGQAFLDYARPLIKGEPKRPMEDGIPKYLYRKGLISRIKDLQNAEKCYILIREYAREELNVRTGYRKRKDIQYGNLIRKLEKPCLWQRSG